MARVRLLWVWLIALTVAVLSAGCGDDSSPSTPPPDAATDVIKSDAASDVRADGDVRVDTPTSDTPAADTPADTVPPTDTRPDNVVPPDAQDVRVADADATTPSSDVADVRTADADATTPPPPDADATVPPPDVAPDASLCTADNQCPNNKPHCNTQTGACVSPQSLGVSPTNPTNALGTKRQFQATITYSDNSTGPATGATWASADITVATIDSAGLASTLKVGSSVITATVGAVNATTTLTVSSATLSSLLIQPDTASIALGTTQVFTATGTFSDNTTQDLTTQVTWTTAPAGIATVDAAGLAHTVTAGSTVVTASFDRGDAGAPVTDTADLTVTPAVLQTITLSPTNPTIPRFSQQRFTATGHYSDGTTQNLTNQASWTSSDASVATVSNAAGSQGYATGVGAGDAVIFAASGTVTGNTTLHVTGAALTAITITPPNPSVANGLVQVFTATGLYSDNSTRDLTTLVTWSSSDISKAVISNTPGSQGVATTVAPGTTTITAALGSASTTTVLTVTTATLVSIDITAPNATIAKGTSEQFTATGTYTDQTTSDITTQVTWGSTNGAVATISNVAGPPSTQGIASGLTPGMTNITAALGTIGATKALTVSNAVLVSIGVTPPSPKIAKGTDKQFTATGTYSDNTTQDLTASVSWASTNTGFATVDDASNKGLAHGVDIGIVNITATMPGATPVTGLTSLEVTAKALVSIQLSAPTTSIANGTSVKFTATGFYTDSTSDDLTELASWSSSNGGVATVDNTATHRGETTGNSVGSATITAYYNGVSGSSPLTVNPATLVSIRVAPATATIAQGLKKQFVALGTYTDGSLQIITADVLWDTGDHTIATVSNAADIGTATGVLPGETSVSASFGVGPGTITGSATLTVIAPTLSSIAVTPAGPGPGTPVGLKTQYHATGTYSNGNFLDITADVSWSSSQTNIATVSNAAPKGEVTPVAAGTTSIIAQLGNVSGSTPLLVTAVAVTSIAVSPVGPLAVAKGSTVQYQAIATYTDNSTANVTAAGLASWTSSAMGGEVTIAPGGLATAVDVTSPITITASFGGQVGTAQLSVTNAVLQTITIIPATAQIARGTTFQFAASGHFSDGTDQVLTTQVAWNTNNAAVATISNTAGSVGLATGASAGTANITAFMSGITGSATLTVTAATLSSIQVSPNGGTLLVGASTQFTAVGTYSDTTTQNITTLVNWVSSAPTVASISMAPGSIGLATGLVAGTTNVTAAMPVTGPTSPAVVLTVQ